MIAIALLPSMFSATVGTLTITGSTTLTDDHHGNVVVAADDVTLDCDGHTIKGSGTGVGASKDGRVGVTVLNCNVLGFLVGFSLEGS